MKRTGRWNRRGFSMLEMTLVILIMGILGTVAVIAFLPQVKGAKVQATKTTMKTIKNSLAQYQGQNSTYPPSLEALVPNFIDAPLPTDGWKRPFYYIAPGANGRPYDLISMGDDGQMNTADDLSVWDLEQPAGQ